MYKKIISALLLLLMLLAMAALILLIIPLSKTAFPNDVSTNESEKNAYTIDFGDASFFTDNDGRSIIVIHYDFTNDSNEPISAVGTVGHRAYQQGTALEYTSLSYTLNSYCDLYNSYVIEEIAEPGETIQDCQVAYVLMNRSSPVEFEVSAWGDWSQQYVVTYEVKEGF